MIKWSILSFGILLVAYLIFKSNSVPEYFKIDVIKSRGTPPPPELQGNARELLKNINTIQYLLFKENPSYKITIHSTYRSPAHNASIGGATNSYHMKARAVDFSVQGLPATQLHKLLYKWEIAGKLPAGGIGQGADYAHYDNKGTISTWKYRTDGSNSSYSVPLNTLT